VTQINNGSFEIGRNSASSGGPSHSTRQSGGHRRSPDETSGGRHRSPPAQQERIRVSLVHNGHAVTVCCHRRSFPATPQSTSDKVGTIVDEWTDLPHGGSIGPGTIINTWISLRTTIKAWMHVPRLHTPTCHRVQHTYLLALVRAPAALSAPGDVLIGHAPAGSIGPRRVLAGEVGTRFPVSRRPAAVEQSGFGQEPRPGTHRHHPLRAGSTLAQPGHEPVVDVFHTRPARYEKQVGILGTARPSTPR
jgi:hypothetical protein